MADMTAPAAPAHSSGPDLRVFRPCEPLRPYVRYYWVLRSARAFRTLTFPIGCPQMIFHRRRPLYIPELEVSQPRLTLSGQVDFPSHVASDGDTEMIVVVFKPHTIGMFIDTPPSEFRNEEISGHDIGDKDLGTLASGIFGADDWQPCLHMIEEWLMARLRQGHMSPHLARLSHAVSILMTTPSVTVRELAAASCLSVRQFARVFGTCIGMPPKEYAMIVRFHKALHMLQATPRQDYSDIVWACGYSDHSHFIREFRRFSGLTPGKTTVDTRSELFTDPA